MDLLAQRHGIRLHERIQILPAIQLPDAADLRLHNRGSRVARAIAKDQLLCVGGLDLAAVVDDVARRGDQHLGHVQTGKVNLGVAEGDVDLVGAGGLADAGHLLRVGGQAVLTVLLDEGEALLVVEDPGPEGVSRDPCNDQFRSELRLDGTTGGINVHSSGKAINLQPALPASLIQWIVLRTDSWRSSQPGSALTAAALYFFRTGAIVQDLLFKE